MPNLKEIIKVTREQMETLKNGGSVGNHTLQDDVLYAVEPEDLTQKFAALDENGKVPTAQLPSYVDDVIEGYLYQSKFYTTKSSSTSYSGIITAETGKIYVDKDTNKSYRWSGSAYVEISASLALGETSSTAYAGNKGKANADAIATLQNKNASQDTAINNAQSTADEANELAVIALEVIDEKYTKPSGGIPASDLAGNIPTTKITGLGSLATKSTITSSDITDGTIVNADIASNAAISTSKIHGLATVATSGKYSDLLNKPTIPSAYTLPTATSTILGGVKLGSSITQTVAANSATSASDRTYPVQKNSSNQLVVNVPWTNYGLVKGYTNASGLLISLDTTTLNLKSNIIIASWNFMFVNGYVENGGKKDYLSSIFYAPRIGLEYIALLIDANNGIYLRLISNGQCEVSGFGGSLSIYITDIGFFM